MRLQRASIPGLLFLLALNCSCSDKDKAAVAKKGDGSETFVFKTPENTGNASTPGKAGTIIPPVKRAKAQVDDGSGNFHFRPGQVSKQRSSSVKDK
ncbi:MAG: hypothetical protein V4463_24860 [Pseudomonadota bacterium]